MDNPNNNNTVSMKLSELLNQYENIESDEEKTKQQANLFSCIDEEMMKLHNSGYVVSSFDPDDITLFPNGVKFEKIEENNSEEAIRQNIFDNALLAFKMYLNYFDDVDIDFIRSHFNEVEFALPKDDVRYFKGILLNGLKVYYNEYSSERNKRDIAKLKEYAYIPVFSFGLIISILGFLTCLFAILYGILIK